MRALAALLAAVFAVALATPGAAWAHSRLISSDPADGAALTARPATVSATFSEDVQSLFAAMTVVGADGSAQSVGQPRVQGAVVSVDVSSQIPAGTYTVNYRVTSADGHAVTGSWAFTLTLPPTAAPVPPPLDSPVPAPDPAPAPEESSLLVPVVVLVVALLAVTGIWVAWRARRQRRTGHDR